MDTDYSQQKLRQYYLFGGIAMNNGRIMRIGIIGAGLLGLLILFGCAGIEPHYAPSVEEMVGAQRAKEDARSREIIKGLQQGGYVIFLRHAKTDWSQKDIEPFDFSTCSGQRNLSAEGRVQAARIGEAYRQLKIPVDRVISSPFCRCKDTAELAFGTYEIEEDLQHIPYKETREAKKRMEYLWKRVEEMLAQVPPAGTNTVLVGHSPNLYPIIDIRSLPEGNTVVFKPDGNGSFELIGMILPEQLFRIL
jgi:broad specificity phosphatase PhoE